MIRIILGPCQGHFRLYLIDSTKVISSKVAKFGSMDIVELHGYILQPGGQLETPGLVLSVRVLSMIISLLNYKQGCYSFAYRTYPPDLII